jgi:hypothetical protein
METSELLVTMGGEVKALEDGKVAGYLVRFSDASAPDLAGDYFTKETDFGPHKASPVLYHHGLDVKVGARVLGSAKMIIDEIGIWIEAQLNLRDKYEKAIHKLAQAGNLDGQAVRQGIL